MPRSRCFVSTRSDGEFAPATHATFDDYVALRHKRGMISFNEFMLMGKCQ